MILRMALKMFSNADAAAVATAAATFRTDRKASTSLLDIQTSTLELYALYAMLYICLKLNAILPLNVYCFK